MNKINMNSPKYKMDKILFNNFALLAAVAGSLCVSAIPVNSYAAAPADDEQVVYVDSVTKWGAWELDIEPAAGGITKADTGALKARESRVTPRTNSFTAVSPQANLASGQPPAGPAISGPTTFAPPRATPPTRVSPPSSPNTGPASSPVPSGNGSLF